VVDRVVVVAKRATIDCSGSAAYEIMMRDPLAEIARGARRGDLTSRRQLFDAVAPAVLATLRIVLGSSHPDLDDVLQDSLLGVLQALPTFRGECTVLHFARRIATKRAIELQRRAGATVRKLAGARELGAPDPQTPWEAVEVNRCREHLRDMLGDLPQAQADALAMRAVLDYSVEEIADATRAPINTVRSRLRLAKETLRERIENDPTVRELAEAGA
jgi:RNA polymerase sigma-70 factor (ECF subfamily)